MKYRLATASLFVWSFICNCSDEPKKFVEYHDNGKLKFEVNVRDGKWHGEALGYYESGALRGKVRFANGQKAGPSYEYYESGKLKIVSHYENDIQVGEMLEYFRNGRLYERSILDSSGNMVDFHRFDETGVSDFRFQFPLVYTLPKHPRLGQRTLVKARLGNADSTIGPGNFLITSGFNKEGDPIDTIYVDQADNHRGFSYEFTPKKPGKDTLRGILIFPAADEVSKPKRYRIEYLYQVQELPQ
jgi:hypothetical protein